MPKIATTTKKQSQKVRPTGDDFFIPTSGNLVLGDGGVFAGQGFNWPDAPAIGEVVFNTGMTGYTESLTDPSYSDQILVFTYPLIGNYGVSNKSGWESDRVHVKGVIVSEACENWSHSGGLSSLVQWLHDQRVPILTGVDTRALTKHLRVQGTMVGAITHDTTIDLSHITIATPHVSVTKPEVLNEQHTQTVIVVDCGIKHNIIKSLAQYPVRIKRVPADYDYTGEDYAGVLLSNGPGDPTDYPETIAIARKALGLGKPIFGICLGSQIMGLAAGARTYKLKFGHRGHNQPCKYNNGGRCYITSQNHGYALDDKTLPADWEVNFRNLNDGSVEGIAHKTKPFFSVQFHPEATPGPTDTGWLFEQFISAL